MPWQKPKTTDETQAWMDRFIREQSGYINARRGNAEGIETC
jgi:hypothetical protein